MEHHRGQRCLSTLLLSLLVCAPAFAQSLINAVPPATQRADTAAANRAVAKTAAAHFVLPSTAPATRVSLRSVSDTERSTLKAMNAPAVKDKDAVRGGKGHPLAVGMGRALPAASQTIALESLNWQALPDGTRAARLEIASSDAAALRVALQLPATDPDLTVRFSGNASDAEVFGPVPANAIADDTSRFGMYWSPTLNGDVAQIEFEARADTKLAGVTLVIPRVAHHLVTGLELRQNAAKTVSDIGRAGSCNIDVACVTPQSGAFVDSTKSVAEILFTDESGFSYLCSGTLLNDSAATRTPYFFTANHCIDSATAARTINAFWFFDAVSCGSNTVPPGYVQQTAGATLLARSPDWDWSIVRLNEAPPAGASFSAWRAEEVASNATISVIHHPQGDLKKWSQGVSPGYQTFSDGTSFIQARYTQGTTEGGSSGAPLLTFNSTGGFYEVRGGLFGGDASCQNRSGLDIYSRFDKMLPLTRQYLTPNTNQTGLVEAVEFYNRTLQHYFISTAPSEINDLDTGVHVGWERTGLRFLAYSSAAAGTSPVCRFYRAPDFGDSHFYSASPAECAATAAAHPVDWIYESPSVFYIPLPDQATGACPAGTSPVWRFFNQRTTNHRYTADLTTRDEMRSAPTIWVPEGYGPEAVIMCSPNGA